MLSRRQFIVAASAAAAPVKAAGASTGLRIRHVDLVHHTHTDVGYTEAPASVREMQKRYLDTAIDCCRADPQFRWTIESLLELDDWWRANSDSRRATLLDLVKAGRMDAMGMPFNQTPFQNALEWRQMMSWIPESLWRALQIRAAMQNDVNGFPRAGAMGLLNHGCSHFLMGLNADSGGPPFRRPDAFWWRMPDGRKLFVWLGEHYGSAVNYFKPAWDGDQLRTDDEAVRAAHVKLTERLRQLESEGYGFERLLLTYTNPLHYDNGGPVPSLSLFVEAWNRLHLEPVVQLTLATDAVFAMEKAVGGRIREFSGEWTDWWANGDASGPRELAASRRAKRDLAAALSPVLSSATAAREPVVERILRDLCLFDEHTYGADTSISQPYSLRTLGQYVEKSELAYRPMGLAEDFMLLRARAKVAKEPAGSYVINTTGSASSGWASARNSRSTPFWVEALPANSVRRHVAEVAEASHSAEKPEVKLDDSGWPVEALWPGMSKPLFAGGLGDFLAVEVVPPADRRTIKDLHEITDREKREAIRRTALRETGATYGRTEASETPHTSKYAQEIRHPRLASGQRTVELWKREVRARISIRFDRISSLAPEVLYLTFHVPQPDSMPMFSNGGVPFTPYRDQLGASCRDYFAIDGWAHYGSAEGEWLWVTRDAALVALGGPHVGELHHTEPADRGRILAMVFDNCWHTNFVADAHGPMEFQFELAWRRKIGQPDEVAQALMADPLVVVKTATHQA